MAGSLGSLGGHTWSSQTAAALKRTGFHGLVPPSPANARQRRSHTVQQCPSSPTIQEEPPQTVLTRERSRRQSRRRQPTVLASIIALFLSVGAFFLEALGQTGRARSIFERWVTNARRLRRTWAQRVKEGPLGGLQRAFSRTFSTLSLETTDTTQRVAKLIRRAMSHEGRLDSVAAIAAFQVRRARLPWKPLTPSPQAASDLVPDEPEPLLGLAKNISDRGAWSAACRDKAAHSPRLTRTFSRPSV
jgi:hypothetical protein